MKTLPISLLQHFLPQENAPGKIRFFYYFDEKEAADEQSVYFHRFVICNVRISHHFFTPTCLTGSRAW